jgi:hypothetical protein
MRNIQGNLKGCRKSLKKWVWRQKIPVELQIEAKTKELLSVQMSDNSDAQVEENRIKEELHIMLEQEELKWKQRAKVNWLQNGDRNTKFFHAYANQRKKRNQISKIIDKDGRLCSSKEDIEEAFISFFKELFTASQHLEVEPCTISLVQKVSPDMNRKLLSSFTQEEISVALSQMSPLKAPGPDGFSASFYHSNWTTISTEVCNAILHFLNTGELDDNINSTFIALIPKVQKPVNVSDFRPISLCNVIFKLISKVLANRLKQVLPHIISCNQSAFIPGRLISDNILVAYETLHTMKNRLWSKVGYLGIKLDMSQAFDRVEWPFLEAVMHKLGFDPRWVCLVMKCVTSVRYSIIVNGNPVGDFTPSRGIRQGDPLSPYLFLLCAECFSSMLHHAEQRGFISGVPTSPKGPRISHLFFADDSLLFCKANRVE